MNDCMTDLTDDEWVIHAYYSEYSVLKTRNVTYPGINLFYRAIGGRSPIPCSSSRLSLLISNFKFFFSPCSVDTKTWLCLERYKWDISFILHKTWFHDCAVELREYYRFARITLYFQFLFLYWRISLFLIIIAIVYRRYYRTKAFFDFLKMKLQLNTVSQDD